MVKKNDTVGAEEVFSRLNYWRLCKLDKYCGEWLLTTASILDAQRDSRRRKTQDDNQAAALSSSAWIRLLSLDLLRSLHD